MNRSRTFLLLGMVFTLAASRCLPHPPNVTPMAATALFCGAYAERRWLSFAIPLAALLLSDALLGFHPLIPFVYGSLGLSVLLGFLLRRNPGNFRILGASMVGSILFFAITNLGNWWVYETFPKTPAGLIACYAAGLPFFANTLLGDLLYSALLFGAWSILVSRTHPRHQDPVRSL